MIKTYRYSKKKFNNIFLSRSILYSIPGIIVFLMVLLTKNMDGNDFKGINVNTNVAFFIGVMSLLSFFALILVIPSWYLSKFSQYRRSYINFNEGKLQYVFWKESLPFLGTTLLIYDIKYLSDLQIIDKKIIITGEIFRKKINTLSNNEDVKANRLDKLIIPNVFEDIEEINGLLDKVRRIN